MTVEPDIQLLMPAFEGERYIAESIRSVLDQTYEGWRLDISIDPARTIGDRTEEIARSFDDPRIRVTTQAQRLGWPGNFNWLVERSTLPFICYWQQDDFASTGYLEDLRTTLLTNADASVAYSDVQWFGDRFERTSLPSIVGSPLTRGLDFIELVRYEPLRGLIRRSMVPSTPAIPEFGRASHQAEFVFLTGLAVAGDMIRSQRSMYFKRKHGANVFSAWHDEPEDELLRAWTEMGAGMHGALAGVVLAEQRFYVLCLIIDRLAIERPGRSFWTGPWDDDEAIEVIVRSVLARIAELPDIVHIEPEALLRPVDRRVIVEVERQLSERRRRDMAPNVSGPGIGPFLGTGWSYVEEWGAWTVGTEATLMLASPPDAHSVTLDLFGFVGSHGARDVVVGIGGTETTVTLTEAPSPITIQLGDIADPRIELVIPDPLSPRDRDGVPDDRRLGVGLRGIEFG